MKKIRFLVLGGGPAGLSVANRIKQMGEDSILVLEKENIAGGLCRSEMVDGSFFDIGGGHFLDTRRKTVNDFLFSFMPENEWNLFSRDSRIDINGQMISHPLEANIWQMKINDQVEYLKSIAIAGCNLGEPMPKDFVGWIYWKFGNKIAADYMIPYNKKMFNTELNQLGTYWLEKLPNVSFEETLLSCLEKKAYGSEPGHTSFYYPKEYGYGELWLRMARKLGNNILLKKNVAVFDVNNKEVITDNGEIYKADYIIVTIPWDSIKEIRGIPSKINDCIKELKHTSIETRYYSKEINTPAQWIYYPDSDVAYHRILVRKNFCSNSKGFWTETNSNRIKLFTNDEESGFRYYNEYAYPLNTIEKPAAIRKLLDWAKERNIYGLGRWGEWEHYNSDVTVEKAIKLAEQLVH